MTHERATPEKDVARLNPQATTQLMAWELAVNFRHPCPQAMQQQDGSSL